MLATERSYQTLARGYRKRKRDTKRLRVLNRVSRLVLASQKAD